MGLRYKVYLYPKASGLTSLYNIMILFTYVDLKTYSTISTKIDRIDIGFSAVTRKKIPDFSVQNTDIPMQ